MTHVYRDQVCVVEEVASQPQDLMESVSHQLVWDERPLAVRLVQKLVDPALEESAGKVMGHQQDPWLQDRAAAGQRASLLDISALLE